jgi:D-lactate dehydrogenase
MRVVHFSSHQFERSDLDAANAGRFDALHLDVRLDSTTAILASGAEAVTIFGNDDASEEVLHILHAHGVRYMALRSAGYNHVALDVAKKLGMRLANVPAYSPYAVAEHTVMLMLALNRKIVRANSRVRELNFSVDGLVGFDMHGKTVGVIGTGKIGSVLVQILRGFGCKVLAHDRYPNEELVRHAMATYVDVETLCRHADIVSLLVPLTPETRHIINQRTIGLMKRGVMLINTSRGGLVDTVAVIEALKSGHIGYLGLDVYEQEAGIFFHDHSDQVLQDDVLARLLTFPNVLITSHQAFLTHEALNNIATATFASIDAWSRGEDSENEL